MSRLRLTSPRRLLDLLRDQGRDPFGWQVCWLKVSAVQDVGWEVVPCPTADDPGHSEICQTPEHPFRDKDWSRLALSARVLTNEQVATIQAGMNASPES